MRILLVRHGESEANVDKTVYYSKKDHEIDLTEKGFIQAYNAGLELDRRIRCCPKFDIKINIYNSPYKRAVQTLNEIKKTLTPQKSKSESINIKHFENPMLREQEHRYFSDDSHRFRVENKRENWGKFWYRFKYGESEADVYQRAFAFYNHLLTLKAANMEPDFAILVSHEIFIKVFILAATGSKRKSQKQVKNCQIIEIEI